MKAELEKLYEHIDDIEIAMMTTRRPMDTCSPARWPRRSAWTAPISGSSRRRVAPEAAGSAADPHVNLSYYKDRSREWVSVSGLATSRGTARRSTNCTPRLEGVVPEGRRPAARHRGRPADGADRRGVHAAVFLEVDKPQPVVLFELVKGLSPARTPDIGEMHHIEK